MLLYVLSSVCVPLLTLNLTDLYTLGQTQVVILAGVLGSRNKLSYMCKLY